MSKTATYIRRVTSKGQVTLPSSWRKRVKTDLVSMKPMNGGVFIAPAYTEEEDEKGWTVIFNAKRDNNGKGIPGEEFLKVLREMVKEDEKMAKAAKKSRR